MSLLLLLCCSDWFPAVLSGVKLPWQWRRVCIFVYLLHPFSPDCMKTKPWVYNVHTHATCSAGSEWWGPNKSCTPEKTCKHNEHWEKWRRTYLAPASKLAYLQTCVHRCMPKPWFLPLLMSALAAKTSSLTHSGCKENFKLLTAWYSSAGVCHCEVKEKLKRGMRGGEGK